MAVNPTTTSCFLNPSPQEFITSYRLTERLLTLYINVLNFRAFTGRIMVLIRSFIFLIKRNSNSEKGRISEALEFSSAVCTFISS